MGRLLRAALVVTADTALMAAAHRGWAVLVYAAAAGVVAWLGLRRPVAGFGAALVLAGPTGSAFVLLGWTAYRVGRAMATRAELAVAAGAAAGGFAVRLALAGMVPQTFTTYAVFVVLPLLVGRYLAQQERLVAALAEQERLRIARDMHDSLGRRLSLASIQAAALEVADLPAPQRQAAGQVAGAVRAALTDLHALVGTLRADDLPDDAPDARAIGRLVVEFQAAGVPVTLLHHGDPRPLPAVAGQAAYRVVEEGLTNAAKHSPGRQVTVRVAWERDTLVLTVTNPVVQAIAGPGYGLTGLAERVRPAGGLLHHTVEDGQFRLSALLPVRRPDRTGRVVALGFATAALMFAVLPVSMLAGVH